MKAIKPRLCNFDDLPNGAMASIPMVAGFLGIGVSTAWTRIKKEKDFPKTIRFGKRCTRLNVGAVRDYVSLKASL